MLLLTAYTACLAHLIWPKRIEPAVSASESVKMDVFVGQLSGEEKADLLRGAPGPCTVGHGNDSRYVADFSIQGNIPPIPRLDFGGLCFQDGPMAVRQSTHSSVFPAGITIASSWDSEMMFQRGHMLGQEFRGKGAHVALGPIVNPLGRDAWNGRGWESFSPDPFLTGVAAEATIRGIQTAGVQACVKHYLADEEYTSRFIGADGVLVDALSSNLDDRTMHELYLWPFANAVHADVACVMCAYNRVNGTYACENDHMLNGVLKDELGFRGYIMSDWYAVNDHQAALNAGVDLVMPTAKRIKLGSVHHSRVDDAVRRVLRPYFLLKQDEAYPGIGSSSASLNTMFHIDDYDVALSPEEDVRTATHTEFIRNCAASSTVLLKNTYRTLPLRSPPVVGVFGHGAGGSAGGLNPPWAGDRAEDQCIDAGISTGGSGSGAGRLSYLITPLAAIQKHVASYDGLVPYLLDNKLIIANGIRSVAPSPDVCIVLLKSVLNPESDRSTLSLSCNGTEAALVVASACTNTVIVVHGTGPIVGLAPLHTHPNVTAIVHAHMPGQEAGNSLVDVLFGHTNPSGHLPYSMPMTEESAPRHILAGDTSRGANFTEGMYTDYRHYSTIDYAGVLYPFGYGLSYTEFEMFNLSIEVHESDQEDLWQPAAIVTFYVHNVGREGGAAVPQLYVNLAAAGAPTPTPEWQLRGFTKLFLAAGEKRSVRIELQRRDLSFWDVASQRWKIPPGIVELSVGWDCTSRVLTGQVPPG